MKHQLSSCDYRTPPQRPEIGVTRAKFCCARGGGCGRITLTTAAIVMTPHPKTGAPSLPRPQNGRASWLTSSDSRGGGGATPYPTRDFARRSGRGGRIVASREAERNRFATQSPRKRFPHRTPLRGYAEKRFRRYGRTPGESRFRIAAKPRAMRTGFRPKWRREAIAVSGRETRDPRRGPLTIPSIPTI